MLVEPVAAGVETVVARLTPLVTPTTDLAGPMFELLIAEKEIGLGRAAAADPAVAGTGLAGGS